MSSYETRSARRARHSDEIEASQVELRKSITETQRLVDQSDFMLKRHRKECEDEDGPDRD